MKPDRIQPEDDGQAGLPAGEVQGPAIITPLHVQDRPATDSDMRPITGTAAWRKLTPLQQAFGKRQLEGGSNRYSATDRLNTGQEYASIFRMTERSGTDSTQALNISRSSSLGSNNDAQQRAWDARLAIESHLGHADRIICRMVLGEECAPVDAIRAACGDYKHTVAARFREALDNLADAMETARRFPRVVNMARRA